MGRADEGDEAPPLDLFLLPNERAQKRKILYLSFCLGLFIVTTVLLALAVGLMAESETHTVTAAVLAQLDTTQPRAAVCRVGPASISSTSTAISGKIDLFAEGPSVRVVGDVVGAPPHTVLAVHMLTYARPLVAATQGQDANALAALHQRAAIYNPSHADECEEDGVLGYIHTDAGGRGGLDTAISLFGVMTTLGRAIVLRADPHDCDTDEGPRPGVVDNTQPRFKGRVGNETQDDTKEEAREHEQDMGMLLASCLVVVADPILAGGVARHRQVQDYQAEAAQLENILSPEAQVEAGLRSAWSSQKNKVLHALGQRGARQQQQQQQASAAVDANEEEEEEEEETEAPPDPVEAQANEALQDASSDDSLQELENLSDQYLREESVQHETEANAAKHKEVQAADVAQQQDAILKKQEEDALAAEHAMEHEAAKGAALDKAVRDQEGGPVPDDDDDDDDEEEPSQDDDDDEEDDASHLRNAQVGHVDAPDEAQMDPFSDMMGAPPSSPKGDSAHRDAAAETDAVQHALDQEAQQEEAQRAEQQAQQQAEQEAEQQAAQQAEQEAEQQAAQQAEEQAEQDAQQRATQQAQRRAQRAKRKAARQQERQQQRAQQEQAAHEVRVKQDAELKAQLDQAQQEAEARDTAQAKANAQAQKDAQARAEKQKELNEQAQLDAEAQANAQAEAQAEAEAQAQQAPPTHAPPIFPNANAARQMAVPSDAMEQQAWSQETADPDPGAAEAAALKEQEAEEAAEAEWAREAQQNDNPWGEDPRNGANSAPGMMGSMPDAAAAAAEAQAEREQQAETAWANAANFPDEGNDEWGEGHGNTDYPDPAEEQLDANGVEEPSDSLSDMVQFLNGGGAPVEQPASSPQDERQEAEEEEAAANEAMQAGEAVPGQLEQEGGPPRAQPDFSTVLDELLGGGAPIV